MASQAAKDAIFVPSQPFEGIRIQGPDFNIPIELNDLLKSYETIGFQATGLSRAIELINKMVRLIFFCLSFISYSFASPSSLFSFHICNP